MKLIIDMDEVICDFLGELCDRYNKMYGTNKSPCQLKQYDLSSFVGEEGRRIFLQRDFFNCLQPFPYALEALERLHSDGFEIIIASDTKGNIDVQRDKEEWLERNLPFYSLNKVCFTSRKYEIEGDLLFDDSPEIIENFTGIRVIMDRPYNQGVEGYRIQQNDWREFYRLVHALRERRQEVGLWLMKSDTGSTSA